MHREWLCEEGGVKLSNANQPTASSGTVHHVYSTCLDARTLFSPMNIMFLKCVCVMHDYVILLRMHVWICMGVQYACLNTYVCLKLHSNFMQWHVFVQYY